ncbi:MAG: DUF6166 domain-containing protein [Planctomycetota bacterium]
MSELLDDRDVIRVERLSDGVQARVHFAVGGSMPLPHQMRHGPTGFEYGYSGSGPADLALSILRVAVEPERADRWYQAFKWDRIAPETGDSWSIKVGTVREWVEHMERFAEGT